MGPAMYPKGRFSCGYQLPSPPHNLMIKGLKNENKHVVMDFFGFNFHPSKNPWTKILRGKLICLTGKSQLACFLVGLALVWLWFGSFGWIHFVARRFKKRQSFEDPMEFFFRTRIFHGSCHTCPTKPISSQVGSFISKYKPGSFSPIFFQPDRQK